MNRNLGLSLITLVMIMSLVGLKQASADPLWELTPPPPDTPTPISQSSNLFLHREDLSASPLPTETPKSQAEQQAIEELQQSQVLGNEQDRAMPTRAGQPPRMKWRAIRIQILASHLLIPQTGKWMHQAKQLIPGFQLMGI